jgi:hypothetical protein
METTVKDYVSKIQKEFPMFSEKEINDIMIAGFRRVHFFIKTGCDVLFTSPIYKVLFYFGELTNNSLKHYEYYKWKYKQRLRVLWRLLKLGKDWNKYYYFGLNEGQYEEYCSQINTGRGRKRKNFKLKNILFVKIMDEMIPNKAYKHFFRVKFPIDLGFSYYWEEYKGEVEYLGFRNEENIININKNLWQEEVTKIRKPLTHLVEGW